MEFEKKKGYTGRKISCSICGEITVVGFIATEFFVNTGTEIPIKFEFRCKEHIES